MMASVERSQLADRIRDFLLETIEEWDPDRAIPKAEALAQAIYPLWDRSENQQQLVLELLQATLTALAGQPEAWQQAIHLTSVYLDRVSVPAEQARVKSVSTLNRAGVRVYSQNLHLSHDLLRFLVANGGSEERVAFFQTIDEWSIWMALPDALPAWGLTAEELLTLISRIESEAARDMARGTLQRAVQSWAQAHEEVARNIIDRWFDQDVSVSNTYAAMLIEGAIQAAQPEWNQWRDAVLKRLMDQNREEAWQLAVHVATFAWPEPRDVEASHRVLLEQVQRLPGRLSETGLYAAARDARVHPDTSLRTARRILELLDEAQVDVEERILRAYTETVWAAGIGVEAGRGTWRAISEALPPLTLLPPQASYSRTDSILADLFEHEPQVVRKFVSVWLTEQVQSVARSRTSFDEILPHVTGKLSEAERWKWLFRWLITLDVNTHNVARLFLQHTRIRGAVPLEAFSELSAAETQALAHFVAQPIGLGELWVPLLASLVEARQESFETVREILLSEAAADYPGECREIIELRARADARSSGDATYDQRLRDLWIDLSLKLGRRKAVFELKQQQAELRASTPAEVPTARAMHRMIEAGAKRAQSKSIVSQLMTRVSLARGQSSRSQELPQTTELKTFSSSYESSQRSAIDPQALELSRRRHIEQAVQILTAGQTAEVTS